VGRHLKNRLLSRLSRHFASLARKPKDKNTPTCVIVVRSGSIGDVMLTTPFLRQLRNALPNAYIVYLTQEFCRDVIADNPYKDELILFNFTRRNYLAWFFLGMRLRRKRSSAVFMLDPTLRYSVLSWIIGAPMRAGFNINDRGCFYTHQLNRTYQGNKREVEWYLDLIRIVGLHVEQEDVRLDLRLSSSNESFARQFLAERGFGSRDFVVVVSPGGGENFFRPFPWKRWGTEKYIELIDNILTKESLKVILVGGQSDLPIMLEIMRQVGDKQKLSLLYPTSLTNCAAVISKSNLFISNDSALMHIGAALTENSIHIFGPTSAPILSPVGEGHRYIQGRAPCGPCYVPPVLNKKIPCHHECMSDVKPEDVQALILRYYSKWKSQYEMSPS
jgi:ADP-heptose:LPS heptosyltransferase